MNRSDLTELVMRLSAPEPPPFALIYRPGSADDSALIDVIIGDVVTASSLSDLEITTNPAGGFPTCDAVLLLPYRQIAERGIECRITPTSASDWRQRVGRSCQIRPQASAAR